MSAPQLIDPKISTLNDDVLLQIFTLNTEIDFDTPHIPSRTIRYTSQVSARWRSLTLNTANLWASSLDFAGKIPWIQTVLERAKDSPLTITYPPFSRKILLHRPTLSEWRHLEYEHSMTLVHRQSTGPIDSDIQKLDIALSLFSRCRRFRLFIYSDNAWRHARKKSISLSAPHLEEVSVVAVPHGWYDRFDSTPNAESTIFDVGISHRPNLEILLLSGDKLKSPTLEPETFLNLTTLMIHSQRLMINQWVGILSFSPQLEVLELDRCFEQNPNLHTENLNPIFLSKLRYIMLKENYVNVSMMLPLIEFPPSCGMDFRFFYVDDENPPLVTKTFSLLQKKIQDFILNQKVSDLSLFLKRYPGLGWKFWNNIHTASEKAFCVTWMPQDFCTTPFFLPLKQILEVLSPDLTSLYLDTARIRVDDPPLTSGLLRGLDKVKSLSIVCNDTLVYVRMLFQDDDAANRCPATLPALQTIILGSIHISKKYKAIVHAIFEIRSRSGVPIPKCCVKECDGPFVEALIKDLRGLGVQVEWDGKTKESNDTRFDLTRTLEHLAIQNEWNGVLKEDTDDWYDSDDFGRPDSSDEEANEDDD